MKNTNKGRPGSHKCSSYTRSDVEIRDPVFGHLFFTAIKVSKNYGGASFGNSCGQNQVSDKIYD